MSKPDTRLGPVLRYPSSRDLLLQLLLRNDCTTMYVLPECIYMRPDELFIQELTE